MILCFHFCIILLFFGPYLSQKIFKDNQDVLFLNLGEVYVNTPSLKLYKVINISPLRKSIVNLKSLLNIYSELNHLKSKNMNLIQVKNDFLLFRAQGNQYVSDIMAFNMCHEFNSELPFIDSKRTYKDFFEILPVNATIFSGLSKLNNNLSINLKQFKHLLCIQKPKIFRNCGRHYGKKPFEIIYKKDQGMVRLEFHNKQNFQKQNNISFVLCHAKRNNSKLYNEKLNRFQKFTHDAYQTIENIENFFPENFRQK